jgi:hypothetical protein
MIDMISRKNALKRAKKAQLTMKMKNQHPCLCEPCQLARIKAGYVGAKVAVSYIEDNKTRIKVDKLVELCYEGWVNRRLDYV